jgi:hypothetical protein
MSQNKIQQVVESMDPEEALKALAAAAEKLFSLLGDEARMSFLEKLAGDLRDDKVASLVHL